jgi:hypothetical protein
MQKNCCVFIQKQKLYLTNSVTDSEVGQLYELHLQRVYATGIKPTLPLFSNEAWLQVMPVKSQKNVLLQSFFFLLTDFAT